MKAQELSLDDLFGHAFHGLGDILDEALLLVLGKEAKEDSRLGAVIRDICGRRGYWASDRRHLGGGS